MQATAPWLGVRAHAKFSLLARIDNPGQRRQHWRFPTSEPRLLKHLELISATTKHLALEAGGLVPGQTQAGRDPNRSVWMHGA